MKGYIYILTNPSFPQYVKIGYADNVEKRVKDLNDSTAVPFSFHVFATLEVERRCCDKNIHNLIDMMRPELRSVEKNAAGKIIRQREFFQLDKEDAYEILVNISGVTGGCLKRVEESAEEVAEVAEAKKAQGRYNKTLEQRYEFWTLFLEYAGKNRKFSAIYKKHTPQRDHWMDFASGSSEARICLTINVRRGHVGVELYIPKSKKLFEHLKAQKENIESELGFKMVWQPLEEKDASRIIVTNELGDFRDFSDAQRKVAFDWMLEKMLAVRSVFPKYCK